MTKNVIKAFIFVFLLSSCDKSETENFSLNGTIKGKISISNELGESEENFDNVFITAKNKNNEFTSSPDKDGKYIINDIPTGIYSISTSKNGYSSYTLSNFNIVGGETPKYENISLYENSKTKIESLSVENVNKGQLTLKGRIFHNFPTDVWYSKPRLAILFSLSENVSDLNYTCSSDIRYEGLSGEETEFTVYIPEDYFPTGSTVYAVIYGAHPYITYNDLKNKKTYLGLGIPSNIVSFTY